MKATRRDFLKAVPLVPVAFGAACTRLQEQRVETYSGNLPGYGLSELKLYSDIKTGKLIIADFRSDLAGNLKTKYRMYLNPESRIPQFEYGEIYEYERRTEPLWIGTRDFEWVQGMIESAMDARGKHLFKTDSGNKK